ncbi:MAG: 6-bladed beta-propeller, partial [Balneolaceae bacterium]
MKIFINISIYILIVIILLISIIYIITDDGKNSETFIEHDITHTRVSEPDYENSGFSLNLIWNVASSELAFPGSLYLYEDNLIVQDFKSIRPLPVLKTDGSFSHYIGNWGKGPGEFTSEGHTVLGIRNGNVLIYDRETSRLLAFDIETGNFVAEKQTEPKTFPYLQGDKLVSRAAVPFE